MQTSEAEKKFCQIHKLDVVAVDLKQQTRPEDKYLQNMALLNEANEMIQSMRTESLKLSKEENTLRLSNLKQLQSSIKSFKNYVKMELGKLLNLLQQQIEQIQNDIEPKDLKMEIKNFDEEIQILSENYIGHFSYNIPVEKTCKQKDIELLQLIQDSIQSQSKQQYFSEIMESIDKIKQNMPIVKQANINKMPVKEFDQHKTPCLNQTCNKHNKEIIMVNVNLEESDFSRLACVKCIQENPIQYISLQEANERWKLYIGQQEDLIDKHNFKRQNTFNMVIKEVKQLKDYYNNQLSEMMLSIEEQLTKNNQDIQDITNLENKSLFELDEQSIEKIIHFLSFKDKNKRLIELQNKQDRLDYLFYQNVQFKLDSLIKHDLLCKQQLVKILLELNDNQETRRNIQLDFKTSPEVQEFISKCQLQDQYLAIFNDSVDLQLELQKEAKILQQKGELDTCKDQDNLETIICSQIQQQYKQFEINSEKMRKLMMAEENEEQLKAISQKNEELQIKIEDEKLEIQQIQQKILDLEQNLQTELKNKQDETIQQMDGIQKDLENMKKSTALDDKLQSLQQNLNSNLNQSIEQLNQTITEKVTQLEQQSQELKKEAASKQNFNDLEQQLHKVDQKVQRNTEILVECEKYQFKNYEELFLFETNLRVRKMEFLKQNFLIKNLDKLIKPKLLNEDFWIRLLFILQEKYKKSMKESELIYQGSRDGLNHTQFWNKCNGKTNLFMIFQSSSGYIFGAYSPLQWQKNREGFVQDDTLSSFIFSQTHDQIYTLKQEQKQNAICCNPNWGPIFGGGSDLEINSNFQYGHSKLGDSYQWDKYEGKQSTHLFGQDKPNIKECEIFELKFI